MVVTWEMALALLLSCCWASRFSLLATGITLIVFTVVLIRLSAWKDAPSCGCFGFLHREYVGGSLVPPDVLRNMMLLFALGFVATARRRLPK